MMICYIGNIIKFLSYRTLRTSILKCGFPTKGMELTRLVLFKVLEMPQLRGTSVLTISVGTVRKLAEYKWSYRVRNFSVVGCVGGTSIRSQHRLFPFSCWSWEGFRKEQRSQTSQRDFHSESMEAIRELFPMISSRRGVPAY